MCVVRFSQKNLYSHVTHSLVPCFMFILRIARQVKSKPSGHVQDSVLSEQCRVTWGEKSVSSRLCEHVWTLRMTKNKTQIEQAKQMKESFFFFCVYTQKLLIPDSALLFMRNLDHFTSLVSVVSILYRSILASLFLCS